MPKPHAYSLVAMLLTMAGPVQAQTTQTQGAGPSAFARAQQALAVQNYTQAIPLLEETVRQDPRNGMAWNMLGHSMRRTGRWQDALVAHRRALESEASRPMAYYHLGLAYAAGGQLDSAFHWLLAARETGKVVLANVELDPLAAVLGPDARYASLFPTDMEFADPFIEKSTILHEWRGEAAGDQFGWIARNIGDADGDRVADVVTSAPSHANSTGKVYTYSGRTGKLLWSVTGQAGWMLGLGVEGAGDVDGDGFGDVIAGAPGGDVAVVYNGRTGRVLLELKGEAAGDQFGRRVVGAGDVNGDGRSDVLVSAPNHDRTGTDAGRVYLYSGANGQLLMTWDGEAAGDNHGSALAARHVNGESWIVIGAGGGGPRYTGRVHVHRGARATLAFVIDGDSASAALGSHFVSVIGDVDNDGTPDIYASDWNSNARGPSTGRIYIHSGKDGRRIMTLTGENAGDGFGIGPADAGDVDGDGHDDIIVGAWQVATAAASGGEIYLYSGRTGALLRTWTGKVPGETLGFDATGIGDVNGDGINDFLVTSAWSAVNGARSGRIFILAGERSRM